MQTLRIPEEETLAGPNYEAMQKNQADQDAAAQAQDELMRDDGDGAGEPSPEEVAQADAATQQEAQQEAQQQAQQAQQQATPPSSQAPRLPAAAAALGRRYGRGHRGRRATSSGSRTGTGKASAAISHPLSTILSFALANANQAATSQALHPRLPPWHCRRPRPSRTQLVSV